MILGAGRFLCDCKNIFHIYFEVRARNSWDSLAKTALLVWHIYNSITVDRSKVGLVQWPSLRLKHVMWCQVMWPSKMGGRVARKICIDTATFITSPYRGCFHKKYQGNWFYISCSHWLSHWICYSFAIVGGSEALFLFHHTSWHRIIHTIAWWRGGGQGPLPGGALVYMAPYTDQ